MKKLLYTGLAAIAILIMFGLNSCNDPKLPDGRFIGTWISTDLTDTLCFENEAEFIRLRATGFYDYFDYSYTKDSITVAYTGPMKILTRPTTHRYILENGKLMIDFTNECFGFDKKVMNYKKKN